MGFLPDAAGSVPDFGSASEMPSKSYRMHIEQEHVYGAVDGLDAIAQACYKILNTERYQYVIYSWDYGVELQSLFGMPIPYVYSELPRRIREALTQDDRVKSVTDFELSHNGGDVLARFRVHTTLGTIEMEKGVTIA